MRRLSVCYFIWSVSCLALLNDDINLHKIKWEKNCKMTVARSQFLSLSKYCVKLVAWLPLVIFLRRSSCLYRAKNKNYEIAWYEPLQKLIWYFKKSDDAPVFCMRFIIICFLRSFYFSKASAELHFNRFRTLRLRILNTAFERSAKSYCFALALLNVHFLFLADLPPLETDTQTIEIRLIHLKCSSQRTTEIIFKWNIKRM